MRNVTVTLDEATARWARVEAARRDMSVSSLLREPLPARMAGEGNYAAPGIAMPIARPGSSEVAAPLVRSSTTVPVFVDTNVLVSNGVRHPPFPDLP